MTDEIDQIMSEIEDLQQEMNTASEAVNAAVPAHSKPAPQLKVVESVPAPQASVEPVAESHHEDVLNEFRSGGHGESESGLDHAIDDLSAEASTGGAMSLLDQTIEGAVGEEPVLTEEIPQAEAPEEFPQEIQDEIPQEEVLEEQPPEEEEEEVFMNDEFEGSSNEGCLTMQLSGNMTLKLKYEFEGQEVTVGFSDGALKVKLADGTEFKVPVAKKKPLRRVA